MGVKFQDWIDSLPADERDAINAAFDRWRAAEATSKCPTCGMDLPAVLDCTFSECPAVGPSSNKARKPMNTKETLTSSTGVSKFLTNQIKKIEDQIEARIEAEKTLRAGNQTDWDMASARTQTMRTTRTQRIEAADRELEVRKRLERERGMLQAAIQLIAHPSDTLEQQAAEIERLTQALKAIKFFCGEPIAGVEPVSHITRICNRALAGHGVSVPGSDGEG